jgi:hypothetical protein
VTEPLAPYQATRVRAVAVFTFGRQPIAIDIKSLAVTYAINSIPSAEIDLAPGYRAQDGFTATLGLLEALAAAQKVGRVPVEIRVQLIDRWGWRRNGQWPNPNRSYSLFTGFVLGVSAARSRQESAMRVSAQGWLSSLTTGSVVSDSFGVVTPDMGGNICFNGALGRPVLFWEQAADFHFIPGRLRDDLWGRSVKPWLEELTKKDLLREIGEVKRPQGAPENAESAWALSRIEPINGRYTFARRVRFRLNFLGNLTTSVGQWVSGGAMQNAGGMTAWDYLVGELLPAFRLALVPMPTRALIVPFVPGRAKRWVTMGADEYTAEASQSPLQFPIRSVRMFFPGGRPNVPAGVRWGGRVAVAQGGFAGVFEPPGAQDGRVIFGNLPPWAAGWHPAFFGPFAVGGAGPMANALAPRFPQVNVAAINQVRAARPIWDAYARAVYVTEVLRGRSKSVTGRLRFDIGPGSTIQLLGPGEDPSRADAADPNQPNPKAGEYAEVEAVTVVIDSEAMTAATLFQLANVRTWREAHDARTSVPDHPLYDERDPGAGAGVDSWRGCPLIDAPEFRPRFRTDWAFTDQAARQAAGNAMPDPRWKAPAQPVAPAKDQKFAAAPPKKGDLGDDTELT